MVKRLEASVEDSVVAWWKRVGAPKGWLTARKMNGMGNRAWPDRMFPIPGGRPFFIEFKRQGEGPTPLQAHNHKMLRDMGYDIEVHTTKEEAIRAIEKRLHEAGEL